MESSNRQRELFSESDELNSEELRVYEGVLGRPTPEDAIGMRELAEQCRMSERELRGAVLHLRFLHYVPIASSSRAGGYWYPASPASAKPHIDEFSQRAYTAICNIAVVKRTTIAEAIRFLLRRLDGLSAADVRELIGGEICDELAGAGRGA